MSEPIILRQSLVKALDEEKGVCPRKAKAIYLDGMESRPSDAMQRGNYFETLFYGSTESGEVVEMERNKRSGEKSEAQLRVEFHAYNIRKNIAPQMEMGFEQPRHRIQLSLKGGKYIFQASLDMVTSMRIETGLVVPAVILDFKITDSILSSFPADFAWGLPHIMDHTQAYAYTWAFEQQYGVRPPFYYLVMDLSPQKRWKFVGGLVKDIHIAEFKTALRRTIATIEQYTAAGEWPTVPSKDNCTRCPLFASCPAARNGADIQVIW